MTLKELIEGEHREQDKEGNVTPKYWKIYEELVQRFSDLVRDNLLSEAYIELEKLKEEIKVLKRHSHKDGKVVVEI